MDPIGILCILAFVIAIMTVVGHGIWLIVAATFRFLSGNSSPGGIAAATGKPCPYCHHPRGIIAGRCIACGRIPQVNPGAALEQDLEATARHLRRLHDRKMVSPEQFEQLMAVIGSDLARLRGGPSPFAQPAPPPVIAEIVEATGSGSPAPAGCCWARSSSGTRVRLAKILPWRSSRA